MSIVSHFKRRRAPLIQAASLALGCCVCTTADASPFGVGGSPFLGVDGNGNSGVASYAVNSTGTAVGFAVKFNSNTSLGYRAVRWDASGTAAVELGNLGTDASGSTSASAGGINVAGTVVGSTTKYVNNASLGTHAVRWDASGTSATELGNLWTNSSGFSYSAADAINAGGTIIGVANKYSGNTSLGLRAARWATGGTAATELGNLGTNASGVTTCSASAINAAGSAVGYAYKFTNGTNLGYRAVRWDASGTAATELGNIGTVGGSTTMSAYAINAGGTVVGDGYKYNASLAFIGLRAVRWDASGNATELANLGTKSNGNTTSSASAVNDSGTAVGYANKYGNLDKDLGTRAVRWAASGTGATELGTLGIDDSGFTQSEAFAINVNGIAAGYATKIVGGSPTGSHAVIWGSDATAIDLNDLGVVDTPPGGSWVLTEARTMADNSWVAGIGTFDSDGPGPLAAYERSWVGQIGLGGTWLTTATTGIWQQGANWSTGTPAIQRDATFSANAVYAVGFDRNEVVPNTSVSAGSVTLQLGGHTLTLEKTLAVNGSTSSAQLTINASGNLIAGVNATASVGSAGGRGAFTIAGAGSTFLYAGIGELHVGDGHPNATASDGLLTVSTGASVGGASADVLIGFGGGHGVASVSGGGSLLTAASLAVGYESTGTTHYLGDGTLDVTDGAHVVATLGFIGGNLGVGVVNVGRADAPDAGGSMLQVWSDLTLGGASGGVGTLRQRRGGAVVVGGTLSLGSGATIERNVSSPLATDGVRVAGNVTLGGNLVFARAAGQPTPALGTPFDAVSFTGSVTGSASQTIAGGFAAVSGFDLGNGLRLAQSGTVGRPAAAFLVTYGGDTDLNLAVNFADLLTLAKSYGITTGGTWRTGDSDYDHDVDFNDLLVLAKNYGKTTPAAAATDATAFEQAGIAHADAFAADWSLAQSLVPEPTSIVAAGLALTVAASRRRGASR